MKLFEEVERSNKEALYKQPDDRCMVPTRPVPDDQARFVSFSLVCAAIDLLTCSEYPSRRATERTLASDTFRQTQSNAYLMAKRIDGGYLRIAHAY